MIEKYRLNNLHAIRGWAALLVVIAHAKYPFWSGGREYLNEYPRSEWNILDYILFGIDLLSSSAGVFVIAFFVLSGFFIARSLEKKSYSPLFFYGDRIIRIYIPYIGSILIAYFCIKFSFYFNPEIFTLNSSRPYNQDIIVAINNLNLSNLIKTIFFIPGDNNFYFAMNYPYWSLFYEALFYIFIPFLLVYLKKYWLFLFSVFLYLTSIFYYPGWMTFLSFFTKFLLYFIVGVSLYQLSSRPKTRIVLVNIIRKYTNLFIFSSFIVIILSLFIGLLGMKQLSSFSAMFGSSLLICWILFGRRTKIFKIFNKIIINNFSHFLGKISFSIYLIHVPIFVLMYSILNLYTGEIVYYSRIYWIPVILMIPISYVFYLVFEKNSLILLKRYKNHFSNKDKAKN